MSVYEIDYPARLTYQVEANSLEEAIAAADKIISAGVPLNAPFKTLNIKKSPMNAEVFSSGRWEKCELPEECDCQYSLSKDE